MHAAITWGEKAQASTSVEGREVIREELQKLQADWDVMLSQVSVTLSPELGYSVVPGKSHFA